MARFKSANDIVNQVAIETGLGKQPDIFSSNDASFAQLIALANSCGVELLQSEPWEQLNRKHTITTTAQDNGKYNMPEDYAYMIDQTGWGSNSNSPASTLSPQEWTYLAGWNSTGAQVTAQFRLNADQLWLYPYALGTPTPDGLTFSYEYISRNWVLDQSTPSNQAANGIEGNQQDIRRGSDMVLYEPYLFERLLKVRFLEARGFDTTAAMQQLMSAFQTWSGKDRGANILNAAGTGMGYRYLNSCNAPDSGYGV